jgi:hypothetical protein
MIIGMSVATFTTVHVIISLIAIASGFIVIFGMIGSHRLPKLTALFWVMTVLTTVTGFMFLLVPGLVKGFTPAMATGVVATVAFVIALVALYVKNLYGRWRWIYAVTAVMSLYLNIFVLVVQSFQKLKILNPLAPSLGPPFAAPQDFQFAASQGAALVIFVVLGVIAALKFRRAGA